MKRIRWTAILMAAALLLGGCSGTAVPPEEEIADVSTGKGSTLAVSPAHSYASRQVEFEEMPHISELISLGENVLIASHDGQQNRMFYYLLDMEGQSISPVSFSYFEAQLALHGTGEGTAYTDIRAILPDAAGNLTVIYESYTPDANWIPQDITLYTERYNSSMELLDGRDITDSFAEDFNVHGAAMDAEGNFYVLGADEETMESLYAVLDGDFQPLHSGSVGNLAHVTGMFSGGDGSVYASYVNTSGQEVLGRIRPENGSMEAVQFEGMPSVILARYPGSGAYDYFVADETALYGIRAAEDTCEEVINWTNSDFLYEYVRSAVALNDGTFLLAAYDLGITETELWHLEPRSAEDMEALEIISLSTLYSVEDALRHAVCLFNRRSAPYRIVIKQYAADDRSDAGVSAGIAAFEKDMTSGVVADIICTDDLPFESYAGKGLFADLYTCMEADEDFREEDYFMNYFASMEYGGKLCRMGYAFQLQTLAAKTAYAGEQSGIRIEELAAIMKNLPEDMAPFEQIDKEIALSEIVLNNLGSFVDSETGICSFDSPEFAELLEFCSSCGDGDFLTWTDSDWLAMNTAYRDDRILFCHARITEPASYHSLLAGRFGTEDVTLVGYPTMDAEGNGGVFYSDCSLAMSSQTAYPEQVWAFLKFLLSEEFQSSLQVGMPVHRGVMAQVMEDAMTPDTYLDENGVEQRIPNYYTVGTEEIDIGEATKEEMDALMAYIEGVTIYDYTNASVYSIVYEEAGMYFAGDCTAEEAAERIQSRVSIYLSEQS